MHYRPVTPSIRLLQRFPHAHVIGCINLLLCEGPSFRWQLEDANVLSLALWSSVQMQDTQSQAVGSTDFPKR